MNMNNDNHGIVKQDPTVILVVLFGDIIFVLFMALIAHYRKISSEKTNFMIFAFITYIVDIINGFIGCLFGLFTIEIEFWSCFKCTHNLEGLPSIFYAFYLVHPRNKWIFFTLENLISLFCLYPLKHIPNVYIWYVPVIIALNIKIYVMLKCIDILLIKNKPEDDVIQV